MKKVLVFMLVISMLLVCSGFATATEAISFPNGRVVSNGIEKPTKEDVETQYVLLAWRFPTLTLSLVTMKW